MKKLFYGKQKIYNSDILEVTQSLREDKITTGKYTFKFENNFKNKLNSKYAMSCSNGTAAIHLCLMSLNLKKNSNILIPSINFVAAANVSKLMGLNIYFIDVDPMTGMITSQTFNECIKKNNIKKISVLFNTYLGGSTNNFKFFYKMKNKYNCYLIEDACHALGGYYSKDKMIGDNTYSDFSIFSFHPVKNITTGEGGMITLKNKKNYLELLKLRNHGMIRYNQTEGYSIKYDIVRNSLNYRISDINCALGVSQLKKLSYFVNYRKKLILEYKKNLLQISDKIKILNIDSYDQSGWHLIIIKLDKRLRNDIIKFLAKKKIFCQIHYIPTYKFKVFRKLKFKNDFSGSEEYYRSCLSLPLSLNLTSKDVFFICSQIKKFFKKLNQ